jgi:putative two-component system hydrogenase maturation factor HypX/HoxX
MRILFLTHAFNSLSQRLFVALREAGHEVSVEFDINDTVAVEAVELYRPDTIIAPFLKRAIPASIWHHYVCLVVHPGIRGDRGPAALDWAILENRQTWGVTVLQANAEMDAGDIWAWREFPLRAASKASVYRNEVSTAAVEAVLEAVARFAAGDFSPQPLDYRQPDIKGRCRPSVAQARRAVDWQCDDSEAVIRKINSADGFPGVIDSVDGRELYLYDARPEPRLTGRPGQLIARCGTAVCRATRDGAVWLGHLRDRNAAHPFKLPATTVLGEAAEVLPEAGGYRDIRYEQRGAVGYLHFDFYNGAMGTDQCRRLLAAYREACTQDTRVLVLMGGPDYWSNGMHLNLIEAADSAADESWRNINAIDDLAKAIITTDSHLVVSALQGNAGAGGVFLARAADYVWARDGVILNPHYKDMGNLYGSEYWTYLLPRHAGADNAARISAARLPMGVREACGLGLVDNILPGDPAAFIAALHDQAGQLAATGTYPRLLAAANERRRRDEAARPLDDYRREELEKMRLNFYGFDPSYHVARYNFVYKVPKSRTPLTIAAHRSLGAQADRRAAT